jgi:bifunctional DNA-binding transcriptional regulator/antitoxin component of YhaV-PrlF toxin-antitoxin module
MQHNLQEFYCTVYKDYKISIPVKIRKLLALNPQDEIIFKVNKKNEITFDTVKHELSAIQQKLKSFFAGKSIATDFLKTKKSDYDDSK